MQVGQALVSRRPFVEGGIAVAQSSPMCMLCQKASLLSYYCKPDHEPATAGDDSQINFGNTRIMGGNRGCNQAEAPC